MNTNISKIHCLFTSLFNCSIYRHNMIWNLFNSVALQCQFTINLLIYNVYIWNWFLQSVFFVFVCLFYSFQSSLNTSAPIKLKGILFFIFNDWISALQATTYTHTHTVQLIKIEKFKLKFFKTKDNISFPQLACINGHTEINPIKNYILLDCKDRIGRFFSHSDSANEPTND